MGGRFVGDVTTSTFRVYLSVTFVCCHIFCHKLKGKLHLFFLGHGWNDGLHNILPVTIHQSQRFHEEIQADGRNKREEK
jgi:hypothetical protein